MNSIEFLFYLTLDSKKKYNPFFKQILFLSIFNELFDGYIINIIFINKLKMVVNK